MSVQKCARAGLLLAAIGAVVACGGSDNNNNTDAGENQTDPSTTVDSDSGSNPSSNPATPTPAPAPAPSSSGLQSGYATANLSCAVGTPMRFARTTAVNYNGGVFRLTPEGGTEEVIVWQTANVTGQRHASSTTFSGPTQDMRGAWLTVSDAGEILGGGIHNGMTTKEVIRCGGAKDGVDVIGEQRVTLQCRDGVFIRDDGTVGFPGKPQYREQEPVTIVYDFTDFPYTSLAAPPYVVNSFPFGTPSSSLILDTTFNGKPADNFFLGQATGFSFIVQNGIPVAFRQATSSPATVINLECQQAF